MGSQLQADLLHLGFPTRPRHCLRHRAAPSPPGPSGRSAGAGHRAAVPSRRQARACQCSCRATVE
eukprot:11391398-Alexandrium_andersonii.AAC.1